MGINLPAHLVIIKGTSIWKGAGCGYQDIEPSSVLQMIGRAGRPGYDDSGTAIIMTDADSKPRFLKITSGLDAVDSQIIPKLPEIFTAEISQQVITSPLSALNWIKRTLFFIRARQYPSRYGARGTSDDALDANLLFRCSNELRRLQSLGFAAGDDHEIRPLPACHIFSSHLVEHNAAEQLSLIPFDATREQALKAISEIEDMHRPCRRNEKAKLKEAHENIKYKFDVPKSKLRISTPEQKAYILLQCAIGQINLEDNTLRQEMNSM